MNAEFQRIARTYKKAFFSEQCQEMEANIEWKRLAISQKKKTKQNTHTHTKMEIPISCKDGHNKGQKWQGPNKSRRD